MAERHFWFVSPTHLGLYTRSKGSDGKVLFCTGGTGGICGAQARALVRLGANACIVGRNEAKTRAAATGIAKVREGAKVIGIGPVDVRNLESLNKAVAECVRELGAIDYVMYESSLGIPNYLKVQLTPVCCSEQELLATFSPHSRSYRPMPSRRSWT